MRFEGIAFDMDGLLFDTERVAIDAWIWAGQQMNIPIHEDAVLKTLGLDRHDTRAVFESIYGTDHDYERIRALRLQYTLERVDREGTPVKPGAGILLNFLDARGIPYTLATSTDRGRAGRYLERAGMSKRFVRRVCGDMVEHGKPEPDIYLQAAKVLELPPERVLALEDAPQGIEAAFRAGMPVVMIPDLVQPDEQTRAKTVAVLHDLAEVRDLLKP